MTDRNQVAAAALQSGGAATPRGAGQGAVSTAHLAMVHPAVYDAVDAVVGCHEPYVSSPAAKRRCGIATGEAAATEMLAARAGDGRFGPFRFLESSLPGDSLDPDARPDGGGRVLGYDQHDRDDGEHHPLGRERPGVTPWATVKVSIRGPAPTTRSFVDRPRGRCDRQKWRGGAFSRA